MVVREGENVNLRCVAKGSPPPSIAWRREGGESIRLLTGEEGKHMSVTLTVVVVVIVVATHNSVYL